MRILLLALVLTSLLSPAYCEGDQAFLAILAATSVQKMIGMPQIELPPGVDLSKIPGAEALLGGAPQRKLEVRLWSPGLAPKDAFATLAPPAGLKQGPKLDLALYRPKTEKGDTEASGPGEYDPDKIPDFTIKIYWGSSETVKPGQPKVIKWGGLTPDQKTAMRKQAKEAQAKSSYFYKPDWTTGYWPTEKQPGKIAKEASLVGGYTLTTNYTGSVSIDAPSNVDFLAPIDLTSPSLKKSPDLTKPIFIKWNQIPNALGLHASIFGMEGKNTLVLWTSSEVFNDSIMGDLGYLQMAEVRKFVEQTVFMKGDRTAVTVPIGIFANADMAMLQMTGYGPGAALDKAQPLPRIQTKTKLGMMLGGKQMPKMDDMPEMPEMPEMPDSE